jgi:hypothetical protein
LEKGIGLSLETSLEDFLMDEKPTYEQLEKRVKELEKESLTLKTI